MINTICKKEVFEIAKRAIEYHAYIRECFCDKSRGINHKFESDERYNNLWRMYYGYIKDRFEDSTLSDVIYSVLECAIKNGLAITKVLIDTLRALNVEVK